MPQLAGEELQEVEGAVAAGQEGPDDEDEEVTLVAPAHTAAGEEAVVVPLQHTRLAQRAVVAPRGPHHLAHVARHPGPVGEGRLLGRPEGWLPRLAPGAGSGLVRAGAGGKAVAMTTVEEPGLGAVAI